MESILGWSSSALDEPELISEERSRDTARQRDRSPWPKDVFVDFHTPKRGGEDNKPIVQRLRSLSLLCLLLLSSGELAQDRRRDAERASKVASEDGRRELGSSLLHQHRSEYVKPKRRGRTNLSLVRSDEMRDDVLLGRRELLEGRDIRRSDDLQAIKSVRGSS
jgi:hypothetical protein